MSTKLFAIILVLAGSSAFGLGSSTEIEVNDCDSLAVNASTSKKETIPINNKFISSLLINVRATNVGSNGKTASKCRVTWSIFSVGEDKRRTQLFQHSEITNFADAGAKFLGKSSDGSKILLDFWTAAGDYTGHQIALYDFSTKQGVMRPVNDRITAKLPSCDYATEIDSVTDQGDVILTIPESNYAENCPNQGKWLLKMKTNQIIRLKSEHGAAPKTDH